MTTKRLKGFNAHNLREMKAKLARETRRSLKGLNEQAVKAHQAKVERLRAHVQVAEKALQNNQNAMA